MAQKTLIEIVLAMVGVVHRTRLVLGHRIDGQVTADQVFFQGHIGAGVEGEAAVAAPALALGARQGIFLASFRVQEHREISADRTKALGVHFLDRGADHQPVDIADRAAEQAVAHGAANFVDVHVQLSITADRIPCRHSWRGTRGGG
ncbi:hypothetical protein D3C75_679940 [compost metagenome]